jgi:hypothetical protein
MVSAMRRDARVLKSKAITSLRSAVAAFNDPDDSGRHTRVLLALQHAFEMLLKAALVHKQRPGDSVFDKSTGRSIGFERCGTLATDRLGIKLTTFEQGVLRAVDAMRDDEQHWYNGVNEQILYLQSRLAITAFDDILRRVFGEALADHLPVRVLPLSLDPPQSFDTLLDSEYETIGKLLRPGKRMTHEARARIRTLLALESYAGEEAKVSQKDVDRVQEGIRARRPIDQVFPKLVMLETSTSGAGTNLVVRITKKEGAPVRYVSDESAPAAAIREVDLQNKFHISPVELADKLSLTLPRSAPLRRHVGIDSNPKVAHVFKFQSQTHPRYSDHAVTLMREAMAEVDMGAIWSAHGRSAGARERCTQPRCALVDGSNEH